MTEADGHHTTYTKDTEYYFPDGTLCIAAEQTMFRVHQGVIARQSEVFRDMFGVTSSAGDGGGGEIFEGAPVIKLDDRADDIRALFSLMYNVPPKEVPFALIDSILRIADKYGAEQYKSWALSSLKEYPSAENTVEQAYDSPKWAAFADPSFCLRIIRLTYLLNTPDLEGLTCLAYYALSIANWDVYDQGQTFQGLEAHIINRLAKGKKRHLERELPSLIQLLTLEPRPDYGAADCIGPVGSTGCVHLRMMVQDVLPVAARNGDVITCLVEWAPKCCHYLGTIFRGMLEEEFKERTNDFAINPVETTQPSNDAQ
ncbi:hypothetical protein FRB94_008058 [Tulasnella sp. JGI-2019a]|nr:hypothetical protein FRB93_003678 [Tulasnella sp. JGI-2019a]KAG8996763.1 hypothetical protein FRB94_008058 [Tulasnella sp. JGI-2019a]